MKLLYTALIFASYTGHTEIVRALLEQKGIGINVRETNLFSSMFLSVIRCFKIIIGI